MTRLLLLPGRPWRRGGSAALRRLLLLLCLDVGAVLVAAVFPLLPIQSAMVVAVLVEGLGACGGGSFLELLSGVFWRQLFRQHVGPNGSRAAAPLLLITVRCPRWIAGSRRSSPSIWRWKRMRDLIAFSSFLQGPRCLFLVLNVIFLLLGLFVLQFIKAAIYSGAFAPVHRSKKSLKNRQR